MVPTTLNVYNIELPVPPIGNKIFCIQHPGIYIFECGACVWQAMANTHQGTGCIKVYDGLPDERGLFRVTGDKQQRMVFNANPPILGMWMFAAGMEHGLTIEISGVMQNLGPCLTVTWMPKIEQKRKIEIV